MGNSLLESVKLRQSDRCLDICIFEIKTHHGVQIVAAATAVTTALVL